MRQLEINDESFETVVSYMYLGFTIDNKLNWHAHVDILCSISLKLSHPNQDPLRADPLPCGVVTCEESYVTSGSNLGQDQESTDSETVNITSMKIFAIREASNGNREATEDRKLLASLTSQKPDISVEAYAMKVEGHLGSRRSSLRLELFKTVDCSAEFLCEVLSVSSSGKEITSSTKLQRQKPEVASKTVNQRMFYSGPSHFLMFMQQLDMKLALLENRLSEGMRSIEDKIDTRVAEKLCDLEAKMATLNLAGRDSSGEENCVTKDFLLKQDEVIKIAVEASERLERSLNDSFAIISSVERFLDLAQIQDKSNDTDNLLGLSNSSELVRETNTSAIRPTSPGASFETVLQETLANFKLSSCNGSEDASLVLASIKDQVSETNTFLNEAIKPVTDLLVAKRCKRGLVSVVVDQNFPYPLIRPNEKSDLDVPYLCDQTTDGGGWIIIQRRSTGQENFYRDWATYKKGFGSLDGDFWIGNDNLHTLTGNGSYELRVELQFDGKSYFARYGTFSVASEADNYALQVGQFSGGTATDSFSNHNGAPFSTYDRDNDAATRNCAVAYTGAWWYLSPCHYSNLNGKWGAQRYKGPTWNMLRRNTPATFTEMKVRRVEKS
ncbi:fibrinogen-related protein 3-2 [Elysia marginata]|uniref:Fibrinogen-related protein 3-2 n=1 Tax=Elysia marginata TaxID=1093978 RepID=A0AAV4HU72_9GAST|nr:fibrinogen-related protein 3-2 [Elysia marginata]